MGWALFSKQKGKLKVIQQMDVESRTVPTECDSVQEDILGDRDLVIVSNRGPFSFQFDEHERLAYQRSGGGLVTALLGLANQVESTWVACAAGEGDRQWEEGKVPLEGGQVQVKFIQPDMEAFEGYYGMISNPLLWFLQHSMWDFAHAPTFKS